jgi:hypothetical protein
LQVKLDDSLSALAARTDEQTRLIDARAGETVSAIDRNLIRMVDALDDHFERLGVGVGERAATAAELAIGARFDDVLARLHAAASVIEREGSQTRDAVEANRSHLEETSSALDTRFVALAKLVRSDSETLSGQIVADQDVTKQALRAMKELQASLPSEVIQMVDERFGSLAESIERSNEMLAARIDRMADTIGQRQNDDIQVVIDRMGDAMHALASLGKEPGSAAPVPGSTSTDPLGAIASTQSGQANLGLAPADRPLDRAVPLDPDPDVQHGRPGLRIEGPDPAAAFDRFVDQHGARKCARRRSSAAGSPSQSTSQEVRVPIGVHAVGDHTGEARGASHLVVSMERVLVTRRVGVRLMSSLVTVREDDGRSCPTTRSSNRTLTRRLGR